MQWRKNVLRIRAKKYVFEHSVQNCIKTQKGLIVVFRDSLLFIEKSGEMTSHPAPGRIQTSAPFQEGVVFSVKKTRALYYLSHPYGVPEEMPVHRTFRIADGNRHQLALVSRRKSGLCLSICRGAQFGVFSTCTQRLPEVPVKVVLRKNKCAVVFADSILFLTLSMHGTKLVSKRHVLYPAPHVHGVARLSGMRGLLLLINGADVFHKTGHVASLGRAREERERCCTPYGLQQIQNVHRGYVFNQVKSLIRYTHMCEKLFSQALPCRLHTRILRAHLKGEGPSLGELFACAVEQLAVNEVVQVSRRLERRVHLAASVQGVKSSLFGKLAQRVGNASPRHAHLFSLLSSGEHSPELYTYELLPFQAQMVARSRNVGYSVVRADQQAKEQERARKLQISCVYVLEDPEHIREVPQRMQNALAIAECKELLSGATVGDFLFDEYDTENRRKKAFVFLMLAAVGRGVFLFERNLQANVFELPLLKVFVKKSNLVVCLNALSEWEHMWPSFHNAVACALSLPNRPYISTASLSSITPKNIMELSGSIFGFGLKEGMDPARMSLPEKQVLAKSLLLTLSQSYDTLLIGATVLGNAFILRGTGDKRLSSVLWFNMRAKDSGSTLLMWSALGLGVLFMQRSDLFVRQVLTEYIGRRGVLPSTPEGKASYYNKYHRVAGAFALACIEIDAPIKEYIRLPDRTCEIILNGLLHTGTRSEKVFHLLSEHSPSASPLNRFYSALMQGLVMGCKEYVEVFKDALRPMEVEQAYHVAGKVFALGLAHVPGNDKPCSAFVSDIILLLYSLEKRKDVPSIVLDYVLLAGCLVLNSTGDLRLLGVCKELLSSLKAVECLEKIVDYCPCSGEYREQYGMRYGRIQHIKMCLSLLAPGCGALRIVPSPLSVVFLVAGFYAEFPISPEDQECFQVIRHFYLLAFSPAKDVESEKLREASAVQKFYTQLKASAPEDIKLALDIVSTYFEANKAQAFEAPVIESMIEDLYSTVLQ
ncbi:hypothetical protein NECID01_0097 [Nematocida sp. AWRm77]|nr:hypothetical protein NECID01_0097 [Nematocida sp. AWRm77]